MITLQLPLNKLLPIEKRENITLKGIQRYVRCTEIYLPIDVVPYKGKFIVGDGHHRVLSRVVREENSILGSIIENDLDICRTLTGTFKNFRSTKEFIEAYKKIWKPLCEKEDIRGFYDYLILKGKQKFSKLEGAA